MEGYDYFDFGCSDGGNMRYVQSIEPSARGLGIDIDERKLVKARANGFEAVHQDILKLPATKMVRFVTMSHFLEHLPSVATAEAMIAKGCEVATDFVLIRQPWFDSDGYLLQQQLKCYWSDWRGHPNRMVSLDFHLILSRIQKWGGIAGFALYGRSPIVSSADRCLIPLQAGIDQHHYDEALHGPKRMDLALTTPTYREIVAVIAITAQADPRPYVKPLGALVPLAACGAAVAEVV